jgi:hypothetical protein
MLDQLSAIGSTPAWKNMRLVGFNNPQAPSAYQAIIYQQDRRWVAYIGLYSGEALNPFTEGTTTVEGEGWTRSKQQW